MPNPTDGPLIVTNLPGGISNVFEYQAMGSFPAPDPSVTHAYFNDFDLYTAGDWTVTETQAGATQAIVAGGDGGLLALTNSAADNDINAVALVNKTYLPLTTQTLWIKARLKVDNGALSDILIGLVDTMAGLDPAYGIYLYRDSAGGYFRLSVENNSVVTSSGSDYTATVADDTFYDLAITYDPDEGRVVAWVNDNPVLSVDNLTNWPTVALSPAIGLRNGSAAARTLTLDYVLAAKTR